MKKYEILEHISDLKIKVFGRNKKELFLNALLAMESSLRPEIEKGKKKVKKKIKINSENLSSLLIDFLSEVNYLNETLKEVYHKIKFNKFSEKEIEGILEGERISRFGLQIKGVTWHDFKISQKKDDTLEAEILFDI